MNPVPKSRPRRLNIRLSQQEWDKIHKLSSNTTCRSISEYARKVLAEKPVNVFYRNKSFDLFEEQMTGLLAQLETITDNFEQLVKKIDSLENITELNIVMTYLIASRKDFTATTAAIRLLLEKIYEHATQNNPQP